MTLTFSSPVRSLMVVGALALLGSCASSGSGSPATTSGASASVATDPATTPAPTAAPTTTEAPTTVPASSDFFLRGDGVGPFDFGATYADVLAGMPLTQISDDAYAFPHATLYFAHPFGRAVCWTDFDGANLCTLFGGTDPAAVSLVGWSYAKTAPGVGLLSSEIGATVNKLVSEIPAMPPIQGACYSFTSVQHDGVTMDLTTGTDEWFGTYADDGTWVPTVPMPAGAMIVSMWAGDQMLPEGADC